MWCIAYFYCNDELAWAKVLRIRAWVAATWITTGDLSILRPSDGAIDTKEVFIYFSCQSISQAGFQSSSTDLSLQKNFLLVLPLRTEERTLYATISASFFANTLCHDSPFCRPDSYGRVTRHRRFRFEVP